MKRLFFILIILIFCQKIAYAESIQDMSKELQQYGSEVITAAEMWKEAIENDEGVESVTPHVRLMIKDSQNMNLICLNIRLRARGAHGELDNVEQAVSVPAINYCSGALTRLRLLVVDAVFNTADYCLKNGDKQRAKEFYREVIVNFVDYSSYVKRAEFALEDMKTLEQNQKMKKKKKS